MKIKIWTGIITFALCVFFVRDYVMEYQRIRRNEERRETVDEKEEEEEELLRVLIGNDFYEGIFHDSVEISSKEDFLCICDGTDRNIPAETSVILSEQSTLLWREEDGSKGRLPLSKDQEIVFIPKIPTYGMNILNLGRKQENPCYPGKIRIRVTEQGYIVINEVALEDYLPAVLASEMSSSFPAEALRAQAVCARTYAYKHLFEHTDIGYGANLDDSVANQVYNNRSDDEIVRQAVLDTAGMILTDGGVPADIHYYSTSCGVTESDHFFTEEAFREFLETVRESDPEFEEPWYRWSAKLSAETIAENLQRMGYDIETTLEDMEVCERSENGQAVSVSFRGDGWSLQLDGEYLLRCALAPGTGGLLLQNEEICDNVSMLPSAWFVIDHTENGEYRLRGGGYGHGEGMSQNGAKHMALQGMSYTQILETWYPEMKLQAGLPMRFLSLENSKD